MRITILTVGTRGDVQPYVAFGLGLERAGHEVRVATHPRFERLVTDQDLGFAPLAEGRLGRGAETAEGRRWIGTGSHRMPTWVGFVRDARSVARQRLIDALAAAQDAEAIVAANLATVLGWQVAEEHGVPLVRAYYSPPRIGWEPSTRARAAAARQLLWLAARPWLNAVRRGVGLASVAVAEPIGALDDRGAPALYHFSPAVVPKPAGAPRWLEVTGYWLPEADPDPDPPHALVDFLAEGPPPVCLGFGTQVDADPAATLRTVAQALQRAGRRGVLFGPAYASADHDLPAHVLAVDTVSHAWLFPRCAAVVHHAGAGTTATVLRSGVPSVAVPHMTDQFFWARRTAQIGVAASPVPRRRLAVEPLADAIRTATTDAAMRGRAAALAQRLRAEDGVARGVEAFERHLGEVAVTSPRSTSQTRRVPT